MILVIDTTTTTTTYYFLFIPLLDTFSPPLDGVFGNVVVTLWNLWLPFHNHLSTTYPKFVLNILCHLT